MTARTVNQRLEQKPCAEPGRSRRMAMAIAALFLVASVLACDLGGAATPATGKPLVSIASPPNGAKVIVGQEVLVQANANDPSGIVRVELWVDGVLNTMVQPPSPQASYPAILRWTPTVPGGQTLMAKAVNSGGVTSEPAVISVLVMEGAMAMTPVTTPTVRTTTGPSPPPAAATATATKPPPPPAAATATATRPPPPPAAATPTATKPPTAKLRVINQSGVDICEVFFGPAGQSIAGNRLTGGGFIGPGGEVTWDVTPGNYDLMAFDCSQNELGRVWDQPIYGSWDWVIPPP